MIICSTYPHPFFGEPGHDGSSSVLILPTRVNVEGDQLTLLRNDAFFAYEESKCTSEKYYSLEALSDRSLFGAFHQLSLTPSDVDVWVFPSYDDPLELEGIRRLVYELKIDDRVNYDLASSTELAAGGRIDFFKHHVGHAGLAAFTSNFESGYVLTMDGGGGHGDYRFGGFFRFEGSDLDVLEDDTRPRILHGKGGGLCIFHSLVTEYLGFGEEDDGKVGGLAGYGVPNRELERVMRSIFVDAVSWPMVHIQRERRTPPDIGRFSLDSYGWRKIVNPSPGNVGLFQEFDAFSPLEVAATAQKVLQDETVKLVERLVTSHNVNDLNASTGLCFAGGLFNNVALNFQLTQHFGASRVSFSMAPGDAGLSLGAALVSANRRQGGAGLRIQDPYSGLSWEQSTVIGLLESYELNYEVLDECHLVAEFIASGGIVGYFHGRAEYGPRSLGARSILGDPRTNETRQKLNQFLKRRDWFMPYAPAILEAHISDFTDYADCVNDYMQVAVPVRKSARALIPGAIHSDNTARIQRVRQETNPCFHELIQCFQQQTGVPCLLNTSFNRHGIATIASPRQALDHFLAGAFDGLWIEHCWLRLDQNRLIRHRRRPIKSDDQMLEEYLLGFAQRRVPYR